MIRPRPKSNTFRTNESGERESAGFRAALPALQSAPPPKQAPDAAEQVFDLVLAVQEAGDGFAYPPEWAKIAHAAKAEGLLTERGLRLYLSEMGKQWLTQRAAPPDTGKEYTQTKVTPQTRYALKTIAREAGVPMQEVIGHIIDTVFENRDSLTRAARAQGLTYPWEAIGKLAKGK
jgi:hypothetical protein